MLFHVLMILLTAVFMLAGLIGSVVPFIPGSPLILLGAFLYAWHTDFLIVTWKTLIILLVFVILSQMLDHLASVLGAKKFGAGRWGLIGAFAGGIVGLFAGGFLGILIGPFMGALLLEWMTGREFNTSLKIGVGTLIGFLGGTLGKMILALTMIGIFMLKTIG